MPISEELLKLYYSKHDKYSIRTSWHQQYLIENILDLQGYIASISENLEEEKLEEPIKSFPLGFFQLEQPTRIRYCHIIFLFTILERRVQALLNLTKELKPNIAKDFSDYKGSFLEKTKQFLQDNLAIDFSGNQEWQNIMIYQKVRDCIIHCGGNINESRDKVFLSLLTENSTITINGNGYILLKADFCGNMESSIITFVSTGLELLYKTLVELELSKNSA